MERISGDGCTALADSQDGGEVKRAEARAPGEWQRSGLVVARRILRESLGYAAYVEGWELFYEDLLLGFTDVLLVQQRCLIELLEEPPVSVFKEGTVRDMGDWVGARMEAIASGDAPDREREDREAVDAWHEARLAEEWARERGE